jgi:L-alanine-DL-glutamate epimerase-like enolase superfamily enzyme
MPVHLYQCDLPLSKPLTTLHGVVERRTSWVLALESDDGLVGLGEAAPLPGFGGEDHATCERALRRALELLRADVVARFVAAGDPAKPLDPALEAALQHAPCARSAVEGALIDLAAQVHGARVAEFLVGAIHGPLRIPLNALVDDPTEAETAAVAGFTTIKAKACLLYTSPSPRDH